MASDKIVSKIIENAQSEADATLSDAKEKVKALQAQSEKETQRRLQQLEANFKADEQETKRRGKLTAGLEERKDLLRAKRDVIDQAFDQAYEQMKNLPDDQWAKLIREVVMAGVVTGTEMVKVPKKDFPRYQKDFMGKGPFLKQLNDMLKEAGRPYGLTLDKDPARFEEGIMLIGEYSDVNASFEVLLENQREGLEYDVMKILFDPEKPEV